MGGGSGGGGDQPPTRPPFFTKPTPASKPLLGRKLVVKDRNFESDDDNTPTGTSGDDTPTGTSGDESEFTSESESAFPDESFQDPCVVNRGPRVHGSSSRIFPIQCPASLRNDLPIHPSTHFITREMCTQTFLLSVQEMLRNNHAELDRLKRAIDHASRVLKEAQERQKSLVENACKERNTDPAKIYSSKAFEPCRRVAEQFRLGRQNDIDDLELRYNHLRATINRQLAEVSAAQFGINYQTSHPYDEFVIFIREDGNILQRTNNYSPSRFDIKKTTSTTTAKPTVTLKKEYPETHPRDKRSNVHTNQLDVSSRVGVTPPINVTPHMNVDLPTNATPEFKVVWVNHVFEMATLFENPENVLVVYPNKNLIFKALTKTMDNNFKILQDLIKGYYSSGYKASLDHTALAYLKFTSKLEHSLLPIDFKKRYISEVDDFIKQQLKSDLRWYHNPLRALEDLNTKILDFVV